MFIHRYWAGPESSLSTWQKNILLDLNPDCTILDWDDYNIPHELSIILDKPNTVIDKDRIRHRSNLVRLWVLREYGGHWVDHDLIPLVSFNSLPFPATASHGNSRCSCWMAFNKGNPLLDQLLDCAQAQLGVPMSSMILSGELMISRVLSSEVPAVELPINGEGKRTNGTPWAIHLFSNRNKVLN